MKIIPGSDFAKAVCIQFGLPLVQAKVPATLMLEAMPVGAAN